MRIIELRRPKPGGDAIAHVDIEIDPGIKLYGLPRVASRRWLIPSFRAQQ